VAAEDAELISFLAAQGTVKMHLILTPQTLPDAESYNVVADIKGSENPEQVVIVSGHLDSWDLGTGAVDDASGVAVAMQTANLIQQLGLKPKRTIRVIAWMNEENGTAGARGYAALHKAEITNHVAAIESDLGASHPIGFHAHASREAVKRLSLLSKQMESFGAGLADRVEDSPETDISPLDALGVPSFGIWQDSRTYFDFHHTTADTFDKIVPRELAENAAVMALLACTIANLPEPLPGR
jgi:Zn-dependent M28 family amino/carboxypeptidase